jgi:hypothetical protein
MQEKLQEEYRLAHPQRGTIQEGVRIQWI